MKNIKFLINVKALIFVFVAIILVAPNLTFAATTAELQAMINDLMAQIQLLQAQIQQQGTVAQWCYNFNNNLRIGDRGEGVNALHTALEKEGFNIDADKNTNIFDDSTASAVSGFQQKYKDEILTPLGLQYGTGFVGKATRNKLNALYGCGIRPQPIPTPIPTPVPTPIPTPVPTPIPTPVPVPTPIPLPTGNQPPTISGVSGPTTLSVNQTGIWTVKASDPEQGALAYSVLWGDEPAYAAASLAPRANTYTQTTTFTHSYSRSGIFYPTFTVTDNKGQSAKTSISVNVEDTTIANLPDLIVTELKTNPAIPVVGQTTRISAIISNIGNAIANNIQFFISPGIQGLLILSSENTCNKGMFLLVGAKCFIAYDVKYGSVNYSNKVYIKVDENNIIKESDENNNFIDINFPIISPTSTQPSITVLSPNGGETWTKGTTQTIKWQDNTPTPLCEVGAKCILPAPKYYDIKLSSYYPPCTGSPCPLSPYREPYTIAKGVYGYSYSWSVGKIVTIETISGTAPDGSYTVQICQSGTSTCDSSDSYFKIVTEPILSTSTISSASQTANILQSMRGILEQMLESLGNR